MAKLLRYELHEGGTRMMSNAKILCVVEEDNYAVAYALLIGEGREAIRHFIIRAASGYDLPNEVLNAEFLGNIMTHRGVHFFVWEYKC